MSGIFRIGYVGKAIHVEHWPDWDAFDAMRPTLRIPADLARAAEGTLRLAPGADASHEIQRLRVNNGMGENALRLIRADLIAWESAGAEVLGLFEVVHGHDIPALLLILNWRTLASALSSQRQIESDPELIQRHCSERITAGRPAIRAVSRTVGCTLTLSRHDRAG